MPDVWNVMEDYLYLVGHLYQLRIHAFVLMSNHFHLVLTAPEGNLSDALLYFLRETSKEITRLTGRINQTYGARNYKTHLSSYHYFINTYKYIYQNPLRAGICDHVENYPYSTLAGLCGNKKLIIPLMEDTLLFEPNFRDDTLKWLNIRPSIEHEIQMKKALRKSKMFFPSNRNTGKPSSLETELL
ncbi:MAG: hypothetical protein K2Q26_04345 [Bdellovibrionales bacterium]|nr:hypothetical protein [Bdellovibrionales bacterium]